MAEASQKRGFGIFVGCCLSSPPHGAGSWLLTRRPEFVRSGRALLLGEWIATTHALSTTGWFIRPKTCRSGPEASFYGVTGGAPRNTRRPRSAAGRYGSSADSRSASERDRPARSPTMPEFGLECHAAANSPCALATAPPALCRQRRHHAKIRGGSHRKSGREDLRRYGERPGAARGQLSGPSAPAAHDSVRVAPHARRRARSVKQDDLARITPIGPEPSRSVA